jgi:hypothetical protein
MTQSQHTQVIGVLVPRPLAAAIKAAAAQRGQTQSDVIRLAVARDLATINPQEKSARPA